jgi:alpha-L-fucosidase
LFTSKNRPIFAVKIRNFLDRLESGAWVEVNAGTTVGYKKIAKFDAVETDEIRIRILDSRVCPIISFVGIY